MSLRSQWITDFCQIYLCFSVSWNVNTTKSPVLRRIKIFVFYRIHCLNINSGCHYREQILILSNMLFCLEYMIENTHQHEGICFTLHKYSRAVLCPGLPSKMSSYLKTSAKNGAG